MFENNLNLGIGDDAKRGPCEVIVDPRFPEPDINKIGIHQAIDIYGHSLEAIAFYVRTKYGYVGYRQLWKFCFDIAKADKHKDLGNPFIGDGIPTIDMNWFDVEKLYLDGERFKLRPDVFINIINKYDEFSTYIIPEDETIEGLDISHLDVIPYIDVAIPVPFGHYCNLIKRWRLNKCVLFGHEFEISDNQTFEELFVVLEILAPEVERNTIYQVIWRNARKDHSRAFNALSHKDTKYPFKLTELKDNYVSKRYGVYSLSTSLFIAVIVETVPEGRKILEDLEGHLEAIGKLFPEVREELYNDDIITVDKFKHYWKLVSSYYTDIRATTFWMDRIDPYLKTKF